MLQHSLHNLSRVANKQRELAMADGAVRLATVRAHLGVRGRYRLDVVSLLQLLVVGDIEARQVQDVHRPFRAPDVTNPRSSKATRGLRTADY